VLHDLFSELIISGAVSIRPAYWSGLQSADNLPQSGKLTSVAECFDHLVKVWSYVLDEGLADYSAEVSVICGNWLPVLVSAIAIATPTRADVQIFAVAGRLEELEMRNHDRFVVNCEVGAITEWNAEVGSTIAIQAPDSSRSGMGKDLRAPVLGNEDALSIAEMARRMANANGGITRTEFLLTSRPDGSHCPVVWQVDLIEDVEDASDIFCIRKSDITRLPSAAEMARGFVLRLDGQDLSPIDSWTGTPKETLLVVDVCGIGSRNRNLVVRLAERCWRFGAPVVLEASPVSHIAALLREYGVIVWPVQTIDDKIETGCFVVIERAEV
jgi:hypothetical protein